MRKILVILGCLALTMVFASNVWAQCGVTVPNGIHGTMTYHYDPNAPGSCWTMPAASPINDNFTDNLNSTDPWHWETSMYCPSAMFFGIIFRCYGVTLFGIVSCPPGTGLYWDLHACGEIPETRDHNMRVRASSTLPLFYLDTSIVEGPAHADVFPPEWTISDEATVMAMDDKVFIDQSEVIPTLSEWGLLALIVLIAAAGAVLIIRKRRMTFAA